MGNLSALSNLPLTGLLESMSIRPPLNYAEHFRGLEKCELATAGNNCPFVFTQCVRYGRWTAAYADAPVTRSERCLACHFAVVATDKTDVLVQVYKCSFDLSLQKHLAYDKTAFSIDSDAI